MSMTSIAYPSAHDVNNSIEEMPFIIQGVQDANRVVASSAVAPLSIPANPGTGEASWRPDPTPTVRKSDGSTTAATASTEEVSALMTFNTELNFSYGEADYAEQIAKAGSVEAYLQGKVGSVWASHYSQMLGGTLDGCAEAGSLVGGNVASAGGTALSASALYDAEEEVLGDFAATPEQGAGILIVHSKVFNQMRKDNLIDFVQPSDLSRTVPFFAGYEVVVDNNFVSTQAAGAGTSFLGETVDDTNAIYASYLVRAGSIGLGFSTPKVAFETIRKPEQGNGGGAFDIYSRVQTGMNVAGFSWVGSTLPEDRDDVATAASWSQVGSNKDAGVAVVISN